MSLHRAVSPSRSPNFRLRDDLSGNIHQPPAGVLRHLRLQKD
jgi:hypothetical protein